MLLEGKERRVTSENQMIQHFDVKQLARLKKFRCNIAVFGRWLNSSAWVRMLCGVFNYVA